MKKYRVGLEAGYWIGMFDFENSAEAIGFMEMAREHFIGTDDKEEHEKLDVCMRLEEENE